MIEENVLAYIKRVYARPEFIINPTAYFYDLAIIRKNIELLEKNLPPQIKLYYAMKANSNRFVMECIKEIEFVKGIEIASSGELQSALQYYSSQNIIFTGPGKTEYELEQAIKKKIKYINVESVAEAVRISNIVKRLGKLEVEILLRVNLNYAVPDGQEKMSGDSTKMGIDENAYVESIKYIKQLKGIKIKGIHAFAASGVLNYQSLIKVNRYIFEFVKKIQQVTGSISVIDLGGGLGIDYTNANQEFDIKRYGAELKELVQEYGLQEKEIIMELGTYIVGNAGYYTAQIVDIKSVKGKKHVIIAGGVNHMGLPLEMRRKHPVHIIEMNAKRLYDKQPSVNSEMVDISGPLCMVTDKLCWDEHVEKAEIGDIVLFRQAGAYCYGEAMKDFLMHMQPTELIINGEIQNDK